MGKVAWKAKVKNLFDVYKVRLGLINPEEVRTRESQMLMAGKRGGIAELVMLEVSGSEAAIEVLNLLMDTKTEKLVTRFEIITPDFLR